MTQLEESVIYICKAHPSFSFRIGNKRHKFTKHELHLDNEEQIADLDAALIDIPTLALKVKKVDKKAAAEFVASLIKNPLGGAVKGPVSAQDILNSQKPLQERDAAFENLEPGQEDEIIDKLNDDSNLILTQKQENPVVSTTEPEKPKASNSLNFLQEKVKT